MTPTIAKLQALVDADKAYVSDGHVLCYANVAPAVAYDHNVAPHLKRNESDVLLWVPHTILGLKADRCQASPWSPGHPTVNANRL
ncbi:MAG: hypothetical protein EOO40_07670 [Deltaproteobacteria bacterium]|nr:MAG: hypothetical protein EOO40_07670 [Deltaproteobacteria bacterium]